MERSHTPKGRRVRDRILVAAERLFASDGFHGASLREVARAARLPLATAVYHFARKEQLYAATLEMIGGELVAELAAVDDADGLARTLVGWTATYPERVRLLLRELLDNPARVARASKLPLAPFLERAAQLAGDELVVLRLVGALSYVAVAWPTIERIVGAAKVRRLAQADEDTALAFARTVLRGSHATRPATTAGAARARARRAPHDGSRSRTDDAARRRVPPR